MVEIWLQSEIDYNNIPGFSVAIINKDKIDWEVGQLETKKIRMKFP